MSKSNTNLVIVLAAAIAAIAGALVATLLSEDGPIELQAATLYPQPKIIEPFTLTGQDGQTFSNANWQGQWDLVFFGFTHCPDICPNALGMMRGIRNELGKEFATEKLPQVTLVSVDPERDTPERLKEYVEYFDASFQAATGTDQQVATITKQLNIAYAIEEHAPGVTDYNVDHFAGILLIDPRARVHGIFTMPHDAEAIANDLRKLLKG